MRFTFKEVATKIWKVLTGSASTRYEWMLVAGFFLMFTPHQFKIAIIPQFLSFVIPANLGIALFIIGTYETISEMEKTSGSVTLIF